MEQCARKALEDAVILIPSLEPDDRLPAYITRLVACGFGHVVVVDDGSPEAYQPIFSRIAVMNGVTVLHHDVNRGKGMALKTGFRWIHDNLPGISGVITADADGQHTVQDCAHLAEELEKGERALYLGTRDFSAANVPPKSRTGNRITSVLYRLFFGQWLEDTQTGLRAFRREDLPMMMEVKGERFEYEMNMLIDCERKKLPIRSVPIDTVYENENKGTHYHPLKDSARIFRVMARGFLSFMGSSLLCVLVDQLLFHLLNTGLFHNGTVNDGQLVLIATALARVVSATLNFLLNKNFVFQLRGHTGRALRKYAVLSVAVMLVSAGAVWLLGKLGMSSVPAKIIVDTLLYFLNYQIQRKWVFAE